ncbi:MAG TPA: UDP-N-acetylmuramoyl-tripeptide--D-alanyl-D-alanine ligase [Rubricoccaceae bacterium]|nr:UDP-N-acetylmuramoyl-tripeptide--D-alanyl-D-alanine ligase [Rubricoccaceae bacterium]
MAYSTDTRTLQPDDVYVAIRGERYDGHDFIPQAIEKGASGIVTERAVDVPDGIEVVVVEDSVGYLVGEATAKLRQLRPGIVAITGSVGKTTTKAAVLAVLREAFDAVASEGNKNTPLGLSLFLLNREITPETKLVLEMGARLAGDLRELCTYFPPTISVVTNVKGVHLETFGSLDGVQREKSELVRALGRAGTACLNGDDPRTRAMAEVNKGRTLLYGTGADCDVRPDRITADLPILGDPAVYAALAAMSVGQSLGMTDEQINRGLARIEPEKGRLNRLRGRNGSTLLDDSYNASPETTIAALRVLGTLEGTRRIAFLGDMLELGPTEVEEHARVLREAIASADVVHAVGPIMGRAVATLPPDLQGSVVTHPTSSSVVEGLRAGEFYEPQPGDVVLVKGSQGTRMERISEALLRPDLDPADVLPRQAESWKQI